MTVEELRESLVQAADILQSNQDRVAPVIDKLFAKIQPMLNDPDLAPTLGMLFGVPAADAQSIVDAAKAVIEIEQQLVNTPLGQRIIDAAKNLKDRPVVLRAIAALL